MNADTAVSLAGSLLLIALTALGARADRRARRRVTPPPAALVRDALREPGYLDQTTLTDRTHGGM